MKKNKTEALIRKSLKEDEYIWGMKLHNNMLTHQTTPADYICTITNQNVHYTILLEAKQVTLKLDGKGRLAHKRLKQMGDLIGFENASPNHKSYFLIAFKDKMWTNSEIYLIPVKAIKEKILHHNNVSFNRTDMNDIFESYQIFIRSGSIINIREQILKYL